MAQAPRQTQKKTARVGTAKGAGAASKGKRRKSAPASSPRRGFPRPRLLPVVIFFAALMLSVKLGDVWQGLNDPLGDGGPQVAGIDGDGDGDGGATQREPAVSVSTPRALAQAPEQPENPPPSPLNGRGDLGQPDMPAAAPPDYRDPTALTQSEIDVLQQLAKRREELDDRSRALSMREDLLTAAEDRIDRKIAELKRLEVQIEEHLQRFTKEEEEELASLVRIYESMKPKDAARIMNDLEMRILIEVATRMKPRNVGAVMAEMQNRRAQELTTELAARSKLPTPPDADQMGQPGNMLPRGFAQPREGG